MQYRHETNMVAVCAEIFAHPTCASGIFFRALNKQLLSQTQENVE